LDELLESGRVFVKSLKASDSVLIVHHADVDGFASGALFDLAMKSSGIARVDMRASDVEGLKDILSQVKAGEYDVVIVLDIDMPAANSEYERLGVKTLVVDHHMVRAGYAPNVVYVNPRLADPDAYQPVSYVAYRMLRGFGRIADMEWLAALGSVADFAFKDCRDVLDKWIGIESVDELTGTDMWEVSKVLFGAIILSFIPSENISARQIIDVLENSKNPKDVVSSEVISYASLRFNETYAQVKKQFWDNAETRGRVVVGIIDTPYRRIGSAVVTDISVERKDSAVFLLSKRGDQYRVSARWQNSPVHLGEFMAEHFGGGGHRNAAGGAISESQLAEFKERVFSELA
jgi:single-stranded DNA-specific DHH superfamily exonuclease